MSEGSRPPRPTSTLVPRGLFLKVRKHGLVILGWFLSASLSDAQSNNLYSLNSPDDRIQGSIQMPASGSGNKPRWSVRFRGAQILKDCEVGLETPDTGELLAGVRMVRQRNRRIMERVSI